MKRRILTATAATAGAAALAYGAYAATAWLRYSHARAVSPSILDPFMPAFEVGERHEVAIAAPAPITFEVACHLDLLRSRIVRSIFAAREAVMRSRSARPLQERDFLAEMLEIGWGVLGEVPGRSIILGAVTKPWEADVRFMPVPPALFDDFNEPGFAKIAWTIEVDPLPAGSSLFRTETRVSTTDPRSRARFRRYWAFASAGIVLIRRMTLSLVKEEAERFARVIAA
jgi:hypothetical protein